MTAAALWIILEYITDSCLGFLMGMLEGHDTPHYSVLFRRINRLDVDIDGMIKSWLL